MKLPQPFIYKDQKVQFYKEKDNLKFGILHYTKMKDNQKLEFTIFQDLYSTQKEAEDKAKELIDDKLTFGIWTRKPIT